MGKIHYDPLVKRISSKLGNFVYTSWKGKNVIRTYTKPKSGYTAKQLAVQKTFKEVTFIWKSLPDGMKQSWSQLVKGEQMIEMNAFMQVNSSLITEGKPCVITQSTGVNRIEKLSAASTIAGSIAITYPAQTTVPVMSAVLQKITGNACEPVTLKLDVPATATGASIDGLESGAEYFVYIVVTDKAFNEATKLSESDGFRIRVA
jgi:hypothetical protein